MKEAYSIGELVKKLKINKETVRYYERIGLLSAPQKDGSGYRVYSRDDLEKLWFILVAKSYNFSLKEIQVLLSKVYCELKQDDLHSLRDVVKRKIHEIDQKIRELEETKELLLKVEISIDHPNSNCGDNFENFLGENT